MKVLALHFGHDSAVSLIDNGEVIACQLSERVKRKKLFIGLNSELINQFFNTYDINPSDIDCVAITSTQREDLYIEIDGVLDISYQRHDDDKIPSIIEDYFIKEKIKPEDFFLGSSPKEKELRLRRLLVPHALDPRYRKEASGFKYLPWFDFIKVKHHTPYSSIPSIVAEIGDKNISFEDAEYGFHYPATATLHGRKLPCYLVNHHAAHAASSYYLSGFDNSAVLTADGGAGDMRGGWFFCGNKHNLIPMAPHHLEIGGLYSQTSRSLIKLGGSPDGKMMGLAPYGKPTFFDPIHVGNAYNFDQLIAQGKFPACKEKRYGWHAHILEKAAELGYNIAELGDPEKVLEPVNIDIAASLQKLFEETMLYTAEHLKQLFDMRDLPTNNLSLAGGCMLNCPANAKIYDKQIFGNVFVPPFTDDSGCAIGAGLWVCHNFFKVPVPARTNAMSISPYLGTPISKGACLDVLQKANNISFSEPAELGEAVAADLVANKVVAFFDGRSEVGPRALGHRSFLSDPRIKENWVRVNNFKTRALWRPFAPAVLKKHLREYFDGGPDNSPYMLFNATAKNNLVPAVTHVDGTSRVQTVTEENGLFFDVITAFHRKTGCAVVMNTSFNGPGEPVIEMPQEAVDFLLQAPKDLVLYLNGYRAVRN